MSERVQPKVVGFDAIPREARELFEEVILHGGLRAIITGALVSGTSMRALLLAQSETSLLRVSGILAAEGRAVLLNALKSSVTPGMTFGELKGRVWMRRRYYDRTFSDTEPHRRAVGLEQARQILRQLAALHRAGAVHGHFGLSNIAREGNELCIVDAMWSAMSGESHPDLAPESVSGVLPSPAADAFAAAGILPQLLGSEMSEAIQRGLEPFRQADPALRPSFEALRALLGDVSINSGAQRTTNGILGSTGAAPRGRLIEPTSYVHGKQPPLDTGTADSREAPAANPPPIVPASNPLVKAIPRPPEAASPWRSLLIILFLMGAVVAGALWLRRPVDVATPERELLSLWAGENSSGQRFVAEAALNGDAQARQLVFEEARAKEPRPIVRKRMLLISFDPLWAKQLGPIDERAAFALGLAALLPVDPTTLPKIEDLHPGVQLAMAADLPLDAKMEVFNEIKVARLATLPGSVGQAFAALQSFKVVDLANPIARSLAKLMAGELTEEATVTYLSTPPESPTAEERLRIALGAAPRNRLLLNALTVALPNVGGKLAERARWFVGSEVAWEKVEPEVILGLVAGIHPRLQLAVEQEADLLNFPDPRVRKVAAEQLLAGARSESEKAVVNILSNENHALTRFQTVSLLTGLRLSGDQAYSFLVSWFETTPDAPTVARLLAGRGVTKELDPFAVEAARYLKNHDWHLGPEQMRQLSLHPEALVRALVYSRLSPEDSAERAILNDMLRVEPNAKIRAQLELKLKRD